MDCFYLQWNDYPQEPTIKGDGEVLPAADGADVQPTEEAADPREGSSGRQRRYLNQLYLKQTIQQLNHLQALLTVCGR